MESKGRLHGLDIEILPDQGYEWYAHVLWRFCAVDIDTMSCTGLWVIRYL